MTRSTLRQFVVAAAFAAAFLGATTAQALAPTGAGALDPTFGNGGIVVTNPSPAIEQTWGNALQPDGKLVIAAALRDSAGNYLLGLLRYLDDGSLDPSFGAGGTGAYPMTQNDGPGIFSVGLDAAGRIFVAGYSQFDTKYYCAVWAVKSNGQLDTTFGTGGVYRFQLHAGTSAFCQSLAMQPDGKVVVNGYEDLNPPTAFAIRLLPNGTPDPSFNATGLVTLPSAGGFYAEGIAIDAAGAVFVSGFDNASTRNGIVVKLRADGSLDPGFGAGGRYTSALVGATELFGLALHADGRVALAGSHNGNLLVLRLTAAGALDPSFGSGGVLDFNMPSGTGGFAREIAIQRDGKYLVEVRAPAGPGVTRFGVARATAAGALDPTFGTGGAVVLGPITVGNDFITGFALAPDGKVWVSGITNTSASDQAFAVVRLLGDEITTPVIEFFNTTLVHYFITADPNEAAAVDGGAAGPGWSRTSQTFKSGGPNKAGRFYGNPDIDPATGTRRGPNGHFYSLDPAEIAQVKQDIGWRFESYDFNAWPKAAGACPAGTTAVLRVYNNRFPQNDSNHRYTTSTTIYNQMVASGWSGEGTVFCAAL